ncbi:MAG: SUF system Fe-S cluster assembly regulator [Alphaproteobacteria bacterium]|nr:SUF system Fe-S cluster assembly regulator [Alphaproteobacteria bacterium]
MLKISKMADYAVVILSALANEKQSRTAGQIAEQTSLPEPTASKILKILARERLVSSTRGMSGGYKLARQVEDITMKDIITAIDGPISITSCADEKETGCGILSSCGVRGRWTSVNFAITNLLHDITLEDMVTGTGCMKPLPTEKENVHGCH